MIPWVFWKSKRDGQQQAFHCRMHADVQCLHRGRILSWPPTSHTVNEMFLYSTVSTLNPELNQYSGCSLRCRLGLPIVGMVVTISPSFNLYKMVVLPAASRPTCNKDDQFRSNGVRKFGVYHQYTCRVWQRQSWPLIRCFRPIDETTHAFPSCQTSQIGAWTLRDPC
jgi:hypothetical protein